MMLYHITGLIGLIFSLAIKGVKSSKAYITCRSSITQIDCYGSGAYCCGINKDECCWMNYYGYWWFWFLWFWVFILITSCCIWVCVRCRRRRAQMGYMVVDSQQTYGSVISTGAQSQDYIQPPVYSAVPPTAPSYMQKPPPYTAVAGQ